MQHVCVFFWIVCLYFLLNCPDLRWDNNQPAQRQLLKVFMGAQFELLGRNKFVLTMKRDYKRFS